MNEEPEEELSRTVDAEPDPAASPAEILRALADPTRLALAGMLAAGPRGLAELSAALGLSRDRVRRRLVKLVAVGLARADDGGRTFSLSSEVLRRAAREVGPARETGLPLAAVDEEEEAVLRHYFRAGRLVEIPAKRSKRRVVLTRLALEFEPGVRYAEETVNEVVSRFHPDHAALRRYLVDEGFLDRLHGEYWRVGGTFEVG